MIDGHQHFDAWNPGLTSEIPGRLLPEVTLYRAENSHVSYRDAKEAAEFCGLKPQEMTAFKVSRLVVHEVLIRVTADFYVPDGPNYEELGLNLRSMVGRTIDRHLTPHKAAFDAKFAEIRQEVEAKLGELLESGIFARPVVPDTKTKPGLIARLFGQTSAPLPEKDLPEILALNEWQAAMADTEDDLNLSCLTGLHMIVSGIVGQRGRLLADKQLIIKLAANWVCNSYGGRRIGALIHPLILDGAKAEGYRLLPYQAKPFIMNVKGASGAGKSTIRPLQRELAERLGIAWQDFALISPDYWRKYLFDYRSIGEDFKYGAMLTGQELEIIDKKLDRYMEEKAMRHEMPHLLIDRFRFDSFSSTSNQVSDGRLLSRFGDTVFLFFVITPPTETVERAWKRGIETGRYKAVDDLLYHNIEAYTGMPQLFFSWVNKDRQKVHFEFLDNDVPYGQRPRTVAFGWNGKITILDPACMRLLTRYKNVNVDAHRPENVFLAKTDSAADMVAECIANVPDVTIADPKSLQVVAKFRDGRCVYGDAHINGEAAQSKVEKSDPLDLTGTVAGQDAGAEDHSIDVEFERKFTIGISRLKDA
jgi:hypothetical protein